MITFKQFLSEAEVSPMKNTALRGADLYDKALEHCSIAVAEFQKEGTTIYRGWHNKVPTGIVRPSSGRRQSENTSNFYTQLFDTNEENYAYPKRSNSLICTTSEGKAMDYGDVSIVFPMDGVKIAVCPKADIWDIEAQFPKMEFGVGIHHMNEPIELMFDYFELPHDAGYEQFVDAVDSIDNASFIKLFTEMIPEVNDYSQDDIDDFKTMWKNLYDYEQSGIILADSVRGIPSGSHELWFSGDCIVMTRGQAEELRML